MSKVTVDEQTLRDLLENVELMICGVDLPRVAGQVERLRRDIDGPAELPTGQTATIYQFRGAE